jgi:hypothetical protein
MSKKSQKKSLVEKVRPYHFELKHLMVLFILLIFAQVLISFIHKLSIQKFLVETQDWYQRDFAERQSNLTATSLELLLETAMEIKPNDITGMNKIIQATNIILSQQLLQHHVQEVCILFHDAQGEIVAVDDGEGLFSYLFKKQVHSSIHQQLYPDAIARYKTIENQIKKSEQIYSFLEGRQTFHVFVPFVPKGEFVGVVYMKSTPDFSFITSGIISSYNEISLIFMALMLFGLLAMFYISSYTVRERDETQKILYQEREQQLKEYIHLQKEALFAKRLYHTQHKAEKIMGFIKEDLRLLSTDNIEEIKYRTSKYASFISRVIYDMKWYDPPIQAIRNPIFKTNLNELIRFIVQHIFMRLSVQQHQFNYQLDLDERLPIIPINEFVVWEILEPLIQNCTEHSGEGLITITIQTRYESNIIKIIIADNGIGIRPDLLEMTEQGVKRLFLENISTKNSSQPSGYGCYIAHEIATQRCGWGLDVENLSQGGCRFIITVPESGVVKS